MADRRLQMTNGSRGGAFGAFGACWLSEMLPSPGITGWPSNDKLGHQCEACTERPLLCSDRDAFSMFVENESGLSLSMNLCWQPVLIPLRRSQPSVSERTVWYIPVSWIPLDESRNFHSAQEILDTLYQITSLNSTFANHLRFLQERTSVMASYTDLKVNFMDDPASLSIPTETDIENRGLRVGRRRTLCSLKSSASGHKLYIGYLVSIFCLFFLLGYGFVSRADIFMLSQKTTTEAERVRPSAHTGVPAATSPPWSLALYSDTQCANPIVETTNRGPTSCANSTAPIIGAYFDNGEVVPYTLRLFTDTNCGTSGASYTKCGCASVPNTTYLSWYIALF